MIATITDEGVTLIMPDGKAHPVRWPHWNLQPSTREDFADLLVCDEFSHGGVHHMAAIPLTDAPLHQAVHAAWHRHRGEKSLEDAVAHVRARVERPAIDDDGAPLLPDMTPIDPPGDTAAVPPGVPVPPMVAVDAFMNGVPPQYVPTRPEENR